MDLVWAEVTHFGFKQPQTFCHWSLLKGLWTLDKVTQNAGLPNTLLGRFQSIHEEPDFRDFREAAELLGDASSRP